MIAYRISDGFNHVLVETEEDADLVARELRFGSQVSGKNYQVVIDRVEVDTIPQEDRAYIEWLR